MDAGRCHRVFLRLKKSFAVHGPAPPQTFRDVYLPSPIGRFMRKTSAEKHALEGAKQWVNDRLLQAKIFDR
jgi:hypothetical protein